MPSASDLSTTAAWERWDAHDTTLDRSVVAFTFAATAPAAAAALDVARRAAGLEDPRLLRILDVVVQDDLAAIIEEPLPDARSLTQVIHDGPLPSEEARRIVGEAATALASAEARGLHHHLLSSDTIRVLPDGGVKVRGLSYEAALAGIDIDDGEEGNRRDAHGLIASLYAALAARWPLTSPAVDLDAAPRVADRIVAPGEIEAGIDAELDDLCLAGLTDGGGPAPQTPAQVVTALRPWSPTPVIDLAVVRPGAQSLGAVAEDDLPPATQAPEGAAATAALPVVTPVVAPAVARPETSGVESSGAAVSGTAYPTRQSPREVAAAAEPAADPPGAWEAYLDDLQETPISEVLAERGEYYSPSTQFGAGSEGRQERKLALIIVGALVGLLAILGYCGAPRLSPSDLGLVAPSRTVMATAKPTSAGAGATGGTGAASGTEAPLAAVAIIGGAGYEPQNGGQVANKTAPRAYDGDLTTLWQSNKWYATEKFGGLGIPGTGLILDLGQNTPVRQVKVTLPVPQDITVYVAGNATVDGATAIGSKVAASGEVVFDAPTAIDGDLVIVYVTKLGPDTTGRFRAMVSEVQVLR